MNLDIFFKSVRSSVFGGSLTVGQVEGVEKIITYRDERYPAVTDEMLAYVLATIYWETGHKMVPVREGGGERYLRTKKYYPWVGEGLVQVTWRENAIKFGAKKPGDLMSWPIALYACFEGMWRGIFTGKRLTDYIGNGRRDYINARRIINGMDRAAEIASIAKNFLRALEAASVRIPPIPRLDVPVAAGMSYEVFCEWLVRAINEDANVRGALIAAIFPDEGPAEADPMDAPHDEWGADQEITDTASQYGEQTAAYEQMAYSTDEPDMRYGR